MHRDNPMCPECICHSEAQEPAFYIGFPGNWVSKPIREVRSRVPIPRDKSERGLRTKHGKVPSQDHYIGTLPPIFLVIQFGSRILCPFSQNTPQGDTKKAILSGYTCLSEETEALSLPSPDHFIDVSCCTESEALTSLPFWHLWAHNHLCVPTTKQWSQLFGRKNQLVLLSEEMLEFVFKGFLKS